MTTAQTIITAAYSRSTGNDPGKLATDDELLGRLNRVYQGLYALAARQRPDEFVTPTALVLAGVTASVALPVDLIDIRRIQNVTGAKVHLIPVTELERTWHTPPSVYRSGNTLSSRGRAGDPIAGDTLTTWLLLAGTAVVALGTVLDATFPTRHHELLVNDLALYLDAKDEDRSPDQFRKLGADQVQRLAAFAQDYNLDAAALEFVHGGSTRVPAATGDRS